MTSRGRDQPLKSSYTDLEPKRIIGSGSFGKCFIMWCHIFNKILTKSLIRSIFLKDLYLRPMIKNQNKLLPLRGLKKLVNL